MQDELCYIFCCWVYMSSEDRSWAPRSSYLKRRTNREPALIIWLSTGVPHTEKSFSRRHKHKGSFQEQTDTVAVAATTLLWYFHRSFLFLERVPFHHSDNPFQMALMNLLNAEPNQAGKTWTGQLCYSADLLSSPNHIYGDRIVLPLHNRIMLGLVIKTNQDLDVREWIWLCLHQDLTWPLGHPQHH